MWEGRPLINPTNSTTMTTYTFYLWQRGLEASPPARVAWKASNKELAEAAVKAIYPDCHVVAR